MHVVGKWMHGDAKLLGNGRLGPRILLFQLLKIEIDSSGYGVCVDLNIFVSAARGLVLGCPENLGKMSFGLACSSGRTRSRGGEWRLMAGRHRGEAASWQHSILPWFVGCTWMTAVAEADQRLGCKFRQNSGRNFDYVPDFGFFGAGMLGLRLCRSASF
jgi:hypothetical protein